MRLIKIGLVHSPDKKIAESQNFGLKFSPVWAYVLASYIEENGAKATLFDLNSMELRDIEECDAFFFSGLNQDISSIKTASAYCRDKFPQAKHFIGGPIAWSFDKAGELEILDDFDFICIGDGEILTEIIIKFLDRKVPASLEKVIRIKERFDLQKSLPMSKRLISETVQNYYGAVIEVSRGCPFLCEFCDIRVMPDNNKNHSKSIDTIISELNYYRVIGVTNFQLACDNFIGDLVFAKELVRAIIANNNLYGWKPSFYTWLTVNFCNYDDLLKDMRIAGFDIIFIGIESFNNNTLLETAKLQNTKVDLVEALKVIQSYGYIVAAGLIFGFDGDDMSSGDTTLDGMLNSALLSGEPSLLSALPGTPLYRRMMLSGRLRDLKSELSLSRHKYRTNIKYLLKSDDLINLYINFFKKVIDATYHYNRLKEFYSLIKKSNNFIAQKNSSSFRLSLLLKDIFRSPRQALFYLKRIFPLIFTYRIYYVLKGFYLTLSMNLGLKYFVFWIYVWANTIDKYGDITPEDFDIESVDENFNYNNLLPLGYRELADEDIPVNKINAQFNSTKKALEKIILIHRTGST
jgi:radical SAM superfamily enzyme YgiQ (UPF0313 family)